uniref:SPATA31 domain-containing protein n=1 Tax=Mus musculus TaxID=10090 RepID=Q3V0G6_MOUSE|nr:unnamed protein product [Mus musculus]
MENIFLLMKSIIHLWKIPCSMSIVVDISFAIMCGVGLFYLLIPFLKEYPESPPPGREKNTPKVVLREQNMARKKTATIKAFRSCQKNSQDTQNVPQPMERPIHCPLLDSSPHPLWYSKEKLNPLPLPQLFSYLKFLEVLIQQKFNQLLWGISSVISEAVVATAWASRKSSSGHKSVRFTDACDPVQALPLAKEPPQLFQDQHLPHQLLTPSLVGVTGVQKLENLPSSIPNQSRPSSQRRANRRAHPTAEVGIQTSLPNVKECSTHRLDWKDIAGCNVQNCQAAISQPTDNSSRGTLPVKTITSAFILPEHYQMIHHHKKRQPEEKAINEGKQKGTHVRFCPSSELTQLQGTFQPNGDGYCKNLPEPNQPGQPSILNSKSYKLSQMAGSVPTGVPLKRALANSDMLSTFKKNPSVGAKDLPCTSSCTPGNSLESRNSVLRTDDLLSINTSKDLSFLDSNTKMKLEFSIMRHFEKCRRRLLGVSKAEYYPKAALILEKLHHQDPGGIRVETVSSSRLERPLFEHSPQETQKAPPTAANHGPLTFHLDQQQRNQNVQPHTFCFHAKPQQNRTIQGTGRGYLQSDTSPGMGKHAPWKQSEDVPSGHSCLSATTVGPEYRVPPSMAKLTNTLEVKEDLPPAWRVSLGSSEIPNGQAINITLKDFESLDAKRSPGHLQKPTAQNSGDLVLKIKLDNNIDLKPNEHPQSWPVSHHPDAPNTVHPAKVSLPSQNSLPNFQNGWQNLKTSQGLGNLMSSDQSVETREFRFHKDRIEAKNDNVFPPLEVRTTVLKSESISQGERLGRVSPSIPSSIQLKDTAKLESQSSLNIAGKREAPAISSSKNITRNIAQYESLSKTYKGQGDSLRNEIPRPVTGLQEVVDRENLFYSTAVELQVLINSLLQNLEKNVDDTSKLPIDPVTQGQEDKVESLAFQMGDSTYTSECLYDPNHSRPARRMSSGHTSSEKHNHTFSFSGIGVKAQSGIDAQRPCDKHLKKAKRRMDFVQLPTPMGNDYPCCYRGDGNKQESGLANQRSCDLGQSRRKIGMGDSPHGGSKGHKHSFRYTGIRDKQEPVVDQKIFDPHQNTNKGVDCDPLMILKDNLPVKDRGAGVQEQSALAAQGPYNPDEMRAKRGKECSPHISPEMHNHSLRYREIRDESQPNVNAQRACDQHLNSQKRRMAFDNLLTPKNNHSCQHRVTRDKQQLGLDDHKFCDPEQIRMSGMGPCPQRSPKEHSLSFRYKEFEEKVPSCVNTQGTHDEHPNSVKRRGFDHVPTATGNNHSHNYKVIRGKQQSGRADLRACDPGRIKKKSGMAGCTHTCPDGYNFLFRYRIIGNNEQPGIVLRACDPHQNTEERMCHGQPVSPNVNHLVKHRKNGGQHQSGVTAQGASDMR